ncbi:multidrug ABC transporter ATPase [Burkholderia gladioli]|uniref:multidrug ABC transporter ATPase n=1 Tax=Burkholderia gladioli TaxID=28095 RepID=UPI00163F9599|nr:multidrug ABC transporter ATPase [Burkholderia gladioli]
MPYLIQIAGALRRYARPLLARSPRGWKFALMVAMLVLPGGSLAALGFAWIDQRRQRAKDAAATSDEPSSWRLALRLHPPHCTH